MLRYSQWNKNKIEGSVNCFKEGRHLDNSSWMIIVDYNRMSTVQWKMEILSVFTEEFRLNTTLSIKIQ
jgi:hypothetical protein